MTFNPNRVRVVVNGRDFSRWASYDMTTDLFSPPAKFAFEIGKVDPGTLAILTPGAPVEIFIDVNNDEQMLMTGHINARNHSYSKGEHSVSVTGSDMSAELNVATAPLDMAVKDITLVDALVELLDPWDMTVVYGNEAARYLTASKPKLKKSLGTMTEDEYNDAVRDLQITYPDKGAYKKAALAAGLLEMMIPPHVHDGIMKKVADAKVKPGESVWAFIKRVTNKAEILPWMTPRGFLCVSRPNYEQDPLYILTHRPGRPRENNVEAVNETRDIDGIPTNLLVHAKFKGKGKTRTAVGGGVASTVMAPKVTYYGLHRPVIRKDEDARTEAECQKRAFRAMKDAEKNYHQLTYTVAGHSQNGVVWTPDTVVKVVDDVLGIHENMYIAACQHTRGRRGDSAQPQITSLTVQPLGVWVPEDE